MKKELNTRLDEFMIRANGVTIPFINEKAFFALVICG